MTTARGRGRPKKRQSLSFLWQSQAFAGRSIFSDPPKPAHRPPGASRLNAYDEQVTTLAIGLMLNEPGLRPYTAARRALELYGGRPHGAAANGEARRIERKLKASGVLPELPRMRQLTPPGTLELPVDFMCKAKTDTPC